MLRSVLLIQSLIPLFLRFIHRIGYCLSGIKRRQNDLLGHLSSSTVTARILPKESFSTDALNNESVDRAPERGIRMEFQIRS
jgi:hypothetical protein